MADITAHASINEVVGTLFRSSTFAKTPGKPPSLANDHITLGVAETTLTPVPQKARIGRNAVRPIVAA
jgi:hypothetical protein